MALMNLLQHPLVLFALGCLVTYLFYHRQKNYRRLSYQTSDSFVIDPKIGQDENLLEVRFAGNTVPQVTQTVIRFWNSGTETIHGHDISVVDPLRWAIPEGSIFLSVSVDKTTRDANLVTTVQDQNKLLLKFDFLDRNDGATMSVLHTAKANKTRLQGIIKGGKIRSQGGAYDVSSRIQAIPVDAGAKSPSKWVPRLFMLVMYTFFFVSLVMTLSGLFPDYFLDTFPYFFSDEPNEPDLVRGRINISRTLLGVFCTVFFGFIVLVIFDTWKNKPPAELRLN